MTPAAALGLSPRQVAEAESIGGADAVFADVRGRLETQDDRDAPTAAEWRQA